MNRRPLKTIAADIATALRHEVRGVVEIGRLLDEAKEQLDEHGRWLPWLRDNFPCSVRTAQNYMAASALAAKYATVAHLRLTVQGLYALVEADRDGNAEAVKAALSEAKDKWVDDDRVREIIASLRPLPEEPSSAEGGDEAPPPEAAKDAAQPSDEAGDETPEPDAEGGDDRPKGEPEPTPDDDRPPPTPSPSLTPKQAAQLSKFEAAAKELLGLAARSAREFLTTAISDFDLKTAAEFLQQVAREKEKLNGGGDVAPLKKTG